MASEASFLISWIFRRFSFILSYFGKGWGSGGGLIDFCDFILRDDEFNDLGG